MALIGGNTEKKEIGLQIGVSGTHDNTEINKTTGFLQLVEVDVDGQGNPIYIEEGSWTSDAIDLGDVFQDFEKIFTTNTNNGASSFAVLTRVSDNGRDWSDWVAIAEDGAIQSDTKQYIQVRIDLFAGFVTDVFFISNSDFEENEFIEEKEVRVSKYVVPKLTSNTSSSEGFAFAETRYNSTYEAWYAFDKADRNEGYCSANGIKTGFIGFCFTKEIRISKYKIRSNNVLSTMFKTWVLQGSNDTTNGTNGTWTDLDTQTNQIWTTSYTDKVYEISNGKQFLAYRIKWSEINGNANYGGIGELDFYEDGSTSLSLKREYQHDMTLDSTWTDTGSLHRKKITRDEWIRIDRLEVVGE